MRIERLKRLMQMGHQPQHVHFLDAEPDTRDEAVGIVEALTSTFHHHGYNAEHDYYWGRNVDDEELTMFVIRG